ncbi:MAG TPA: hypothetical protein VKD66_14325 [Streptosporangiaceae bacterium]|nr:hypothetical protein [Streptosporangiaceae bacterium]
MRPAEPLRAAAAVWDIAVPPRPGRVAGVRMAGFSERAKDLVDLPVVSIRLPPNATTAPDKR